MLEDHPVLMDRLKALAVFSGIAVGAVAGLELVISGGFDFITPGNEIREAAPSAYVQVVDDLWSPQARVISLSSTEPYFADDYEPPAPDALAGGDAEAPVGGYPEAQSEDELYAAVDALYAQQEESYRAEYAPAEYFESEAAENPDAVYAAGGKSDASVSESASPW